MRVKPVLLMVAIFALVSGCSHRLYWLQMTQDKEVLDGYDEDQSLRDHVATLVKGPAVKGQNCRWFTISTSGTETTRRGAYTDAFEKAGPPYDALIDVLQTSISYPPLPLYCVSLEGTAVKSETQYATIQSSSGKGKPQVNPDNRQSHN